MLRSISAFLTALVTWVLVASIIDRGLRVGMDGYAAAEPIMAFSLGMMFARLAMGAMASLAAGLVMKWVAPQSTRAPWLFGLVLLAAFVPQHIRLWQHFPVWYHLTFLLTILPLVLAGSHLANIRRGDTRLVASSHGAP